MSKNAYGNEQRIKAPPVEASIDQNSDPKIANAVVVKSSGTQRKTV